MNTATHFLLLVFYFVFFELAPAQLEHCHPASNGLPHQLCGNHALPPGVCLWPNPKSLQNISAAELGAHCDFVVLDPEFLYVLGKDPKLHLVASALAHEGGAYDPYHDEFYFSSTWTKDDLPNKLMKLSLRTWEVSVVFNKTLMANGMAMDGFGSLIVCEQGLGSAKGFVQRVNLTTLRTSVVADNWKGLPFNSPNDVVVKRDGSIWFTDPDYGWSEKFKGRPRVSNQVYRISPVGVVEAVADGFVKPNGLAFSQDEKLLYVTDTGSSIGDGTFNGSKPHSITVFQVSQDGASLTGRRLFASVANLVGSYPGVGVPDGIRVDQNGRVYTANNDGIQVFSPQGKLLGLIRVEGAVNMGFAGHEFNHMIIVNISAIHAVQLNVQGAGLLLANLND